MSDGSNNKLSRLVYKNIDSLLLILTGLGPVSSDEDMLVDEAESRLVDGAVIFIQVVLTADHGQTVLGSRLVGREAHLIKLWVKNALLL